MKFACEKCSTRYSIADDRVRGRVLKIRCKSCGEIITVRESHALSDGPIAAPAPVAPAPGDGTQLQPAPPPTDDAPLDDWFVSFDGEQEGPFSLTQAIERVRAERPKGKEAHAWRPGFFMWLPIEEVPEFAPALVTPKASAPPPIPVTVPAPKRDSKPMAAVKADPTPAPEPRPMFSPSPTPLAQLAPTPAAVAPLPTPSSANFSLADYPAAPADDSPVSAPGDDFVVSEPSQIVNLRDLARAAGAKTPSALGQPLSSGTGPAPSLGGPSLELPAQPAYSSLPPVSDHATWKWIAIVGIAGMLGLGGAVVYLLNRGPEAVVTFGDAPRVIYNAPIAIVDPMVPSSGGAIEEAKRLAKAGGAKKGTAAPAGAKGGATPTAVAAAPGGNSMYDDVREREVGSAPQRASAGQVDPATISKVVSSNKRQLDTCFQRSLKRDPTLTGGKVNIEIAVGISGSVTNAKLTGDAVQGDLGQCLNDAIRRWHFPESGESYSIPFSIILQSK